MDRYSTYICKVIKFFIGEELNQLEFFILEKCESQLDT